MHVARKQHYHLTNGASRGLARNEDVKMPLRPVSAHGGISGARRAGIWNRRGWRVRAGHLHTCCRIPCRHSA